MVGVGLHNFPHTRYCDRNPDVFAFTVDIYYAQNVSVYKEQLSTTFPNKASIRSVHEVELAMWSYLS